MMQASRPGTGAGMERPFEGLGIFALERVQVGLLDFRQEAADRVADRVLRSGVAAGRWC